MPQQWEEGLTEYLLKEMRAKYKNPALMWAGGKDSTAQLYIARESFKSLGRIPFPVIFLDTGYKFRETYEFMDKIKDAWGVELIKAENRDAKMKGIGPNTSSKFECCTALKTQTLINTIKEYKFDAIAVAIRWDEHGVRGKEQVFSPRSNPDHMRVHPMLHWHLPILWDYIKREKIPMNPLYDRIEHGNLVYRSIGCYPCTKPIPKDEVGLYAERSGRMQDKEDRMQELRALGYL